MWLVNSDPHYKIWQKNEMYWISAEGLSRRAKENGLHQNSPTSMEELKYFRYRKAG